MISDIVELIAANLETNKNTLLGSYVSTIIIDKALDPLDMFEKQESGLWVIPMTTERQMQASNKRGALKQVYKGQVIAVCLSLGFGTKTEKDVAPWTEVAAILDMRERIDDHICTTEWGLDILEVNSAPPHEVMQGQRWFLAVTEYTFGESSC